jgi:hypothetical protein
MVKPSAILRFDCPIPGSIFEFTTNIEKSELALTTMLGFDMLIFNPQKKRLRKT